MSSLYKQIWDELSVIDVNEHVEKKMNLSYLSWAWAYSTLMKYYPHNSYSFTQTVEADGSVTVECMLTIHQGDEVAVRTMWLPVMDNKNQAIPNPSARQISDNKMRCLVKCIAMFGLGHYIYAGEDLPEEEKKKIIGKEKITMQDACVAIREGIENKDPVLLFETEQEFRGDDEHILGAVKRWLNGDQVKEWKAIVDQGRKDGVIGGE